MMLLGPDSFWFLHHLLCCFTNQCKSRPGSCHHSWHSNHRKEKEKDMPLPFKGMTRKDQVILLSWIVQAHPDHAWLWQRLAVVLFWVAMCAPHTVG